MGGGGWGDEIHDGEKNTRKQPKGTYQWVRKFYGVPLGVEKDLRAETIASACKSVDSGRTGPIPPFGEQSRHFNTTRNHLGKFIYCGGGDDSRIQHAKTHFWRAIEKISVGDNKSSDKELGIGLHSLQDLFAHDDSYITYDHWIKGVLPIPKKIVHHVDKDGVGKGADDPYHTKSSYNRPHLAQPPIETGIQPLQELSNRYLDTKAATYIYLAMFEVVTTNDRSEIYKTIDKLNILLSKIPVVKKRLRGFLEEFRIIKGKYFYIGLQYDIDESKPLKFWIVHIIQIMSKEQEDFIKDKRLSQTERLIRRCEDLLREEKFKGWLIEKYKKINDQYVFEKVDEFYVKIRPQAGDAEIVEKFHSQLDEIFVNEDLFKLFMSSKFSAMDYYLSLVLPKDIQNDELQRLVDIHEYIELCIRDLEEVSRVCHEDDIWLGILYYNLGKAYAILGFREAQIRELEKALEIKKKYYQEVPNEEVILILRDIVKAYGFPREEDKRQKQIERLNDLLKRQKEYYGEVGIGVAETLNYLGKMYGLLKGTREQKECLQRSLDIKKEVYGEGDKEVAIAFQDLAYAYGSSGDHMEQQRLLKGALKILKGYYGNKHHGDILEVYHDLADSYGSDGQVKKQRQVLKRIRNIKEKYGQDDHMELARTLYDLAVTYEFKNEKREKLLQQAFSKFPRLSKGNRLLADICFELGLVYVELENSEEASSFFKNARDILPDDEGFCLKIDTELKKLSPTEGKGKRKAFTQDVGNFSLSPKRSRRSRSSSSSSAASSSTSHRPT